jgi:hypothetical protein
MYKLVSYFIGFWLLFREKMAICADGCLMCDGKDTCKICDAASLYVLVKDTCIQQDLEFCMLSFNFGACAFCFDGYYLETNKKCVTNPVGVNQIKNCQRYSSFTRCAQCQKNFFLSDNNRKCSKVVDKIQNCKVYSGNSTCSICSDSILNALGDNCNTPDRVDDNCMFYSNKTVCSSCSDGYYLNLNSYNEQIIDVYQTLVYASFDYSFTFNTVLNLPQCTIISAIPNCIQMDDKFNCLKCSTGYFVNSITLRECLKNPDSNSLSASTDIPFCYINNKVAVTVSGITTIDVTCQFCYEGYYVAVNGKKCSKHEQVVKNCAIYSQTKNTECIACADGYFRANIGNEKCILRGENTGCKIVNPMAQTCDTCIKDNYIKYYNSTLCAPPIANCKVYNYDSQILTCQICEANYYFNINTKTCEINPNFDPYCSYYDQDGKCSKCYLGFFYNKISGKCEPSDAEYVNMANCADYDLNQKNTCVDCANYNVLIQLSNNCKLIPFDSTLFNINKITNCDTYEIDTEGNYQCTKPVYMNESEIPYCKPDLSNCTVRVLNTTDHLVYTNPKSTSNCIKYETTVSSLNSVKCLSCAKNITMVDYFYTANVCDSSDKIPWCPDGDLFRGNSNFCFNATGSGGKIYMGSSNSATTKFVTTSYPTSGASFVFCQTKNVGIPCFYINTTPYYSDYPCGHNPPFTVGSTRYCKYFDNYICQTAGYYERTLTYNVTLTEDNTECIIERIYHTIDNCFKISNAYCVLCKRNFFPDRYKQVLYSKDYTETYVSHVNENSNMENCISFDSTVNECRRCDPNSGTKLNFSGRCVSCTTSDKVMDKTELVCLSFFSESLIPGSCLKADDSYSPYLCIQCIDTYVAVYDVILKTPIALSTGEYLWVGGVRTYVYKIVDTFAVSSCVKKSDLFISNISYKVNSQNCDWARIVLGTQYCLKCIFGYSGVLGLTSSNLQFVENCSINAGCDMNTRYIFNQTHVRQMLSCHKCVSNSKIVTLYMYFETSATASNAIFNFSNDTFTWSCEPIDPSLDKNCLVQLYVTDTIFKAKISNKSYLCLTCPPKYKATTAAVPDNFYPFNYVTSCTFIQNCMESNITNICEQCDPNYTISDDKTACLPISVNSPDLAYCNQLAVNLGTTYCSKCKNGYIYLETSTVYQCLPYSISNCLYYVENNCVQSTKKMGIAYNIIYRRIFSEYYINQPTCKAANSYIPNCEFYKTNTTCYICSDTYSLGNKNTTCYQQLTTNCAAYDDELMKCSACNPGYFLTTLRQCDVSVGSGVTNCVKYSGIFCTECITGFYPIRINAGKGSICVNVTISNLCDEIDYTQLDNNLILECKTCSKLSVVNTKLLSASISINQYSFISNTTFSKFKANNNQLDYDATIRSFTYLRAAKANYQNTFVCKQYGGVPNCVKHDDLGFSNSFKCVQCATMNYLQNNNCPVRTLIDNCVLYDPTADNCLQFLDSSNFAFSYSTFDIMVMNKNIPVYPGDGSNVISIVGCIKYLDNQSCKYCNSTMYLYDNLCLDVSVLIPNCNIYQANMVCMECIVGFLLMQNKCLTIYALNCDGYLTNTKCLRCKPEFPLLKSDGNCYKNPAIFNCDVFANPLYCHWCSADYTNIKGICHLPTSYVTNCERHMGTSLCMKCSEGKVLAGNLKSCELNPTYDRNCNNFVTKSFCIVCKAGYYFKGHSCFPCLTDSNKCWICDNNNPSSCKVCRSGFFMDNFGNCLQSVGYQNQAILNLNQDTLNMNSIKS